MVKRTISKLVFYLFVGFIINFAIAWGCATFLPFEGDWPTYKSGWASEELMEEQFQQTLRDFTIAPADYPINVSSKHGIGWTMSFGDVGHVEGGFVISAGWPFRSLYGGLLMSSGRQEYVHSLRFPMGMLPGQMLPLQPLLLGTGANTLLYSGIIWVCRRRQIAFRSKLRLKRGLCPNCLYPIGESPKCSECGGAL